jgi:beta-mannosidase
LSFDGKQLASGDMKVHFIRGKVNFQLPRNETPLWWPRGFGDANLCDIELTFKKDDTTLCSWQSKWGLSRIRLDRDQGITPDGKGEFKFVVNNEPCYIMGTNWKPTDAIPARAEEKVLPLLESARDLGCNMIRIWGGGFYENDKFFNWCDENGIMVWQDFMFAGEYPILDNAYCDVVANEARAIIESLRNHVSLAVWCGDNEDDEFLHWNHSETSILPSDNKISREVLKQAVLRFDPYRKYIESSPYISDTNWKERHAPDVEDWKTRHPKNVTEYMCEVHLYTSVPTLPKVLRECKSRFIGETGPYYTCAISDNKDIFAREYPRLARLWDEYLPTNKRNIQHHQTDTYLQTWVQVSRELCTTWFNRDFTLEQWSDFKFGVNVICSSIYKEVIEYCRIDRPNKTGVMWWSLADMWQMLFNYSVIDSEGGKKMPYYWIKQSQQPFALMMVRYELDGEIALYSANNTLENHFGNYRIVAIDENNNERVVALGEYNEPKNNSRMLQRIPEPKSPTLFIIQWNENGKTSYNHFVSGKNPISIETWKLWCERINKIL